jgi:RES domain
MSGGRWNSPGVHALYAASSISPAVLEILVHLRNVALIPEDYVVSTATIPDELIAPFPETRGEGSRHSLSPRFCRENLEIVSCGGAGAPIG